MWLNDKEERIYGPFAQYIEENIDKRFRFTYSSGLELVVEYETEYESENGLDINDDGYEEYWEMAFKIIEVVNDDTNLYEVGGYILVNYLSIPMKFIVDSH